MMTSSNGNIFRVTGPLCGEFTGHKGQWRGALMFLLIYAWINVRANNRTAGDLRRHRAHYDVTVMFMDSVFTNGIVFGTFLICNWLRASSWCWWCPGAKKAPGHEQPPCWIDQGDIITLSKPQMHHIIQASHVSCCNDKHIYFDIRTARYLFIYSLLYLFIIYYIFIDLLFIYSFIYLFIYLFIIHRSIFHTNNVIPAVLTCHVIQWSLYTGFIANLPSLVQIMAWRLDGAKPLSEQMMEYC